MSITVKSLHIYPLKSGAAIDLKSFNLTARGPQYDRLWMVVKQPESAEDWQNPLTFLTQRDKGCGILATVKAESFDDGSCAFSAPGMRPTLVDREEIASTIPLQAKIHRSFGTVYDAGSDAAAWISKFLGQPARLVRIADDHVRVANPDFYNEGDQVSLADGAPVLVTSQNSLEELRKYLPADANIGMERFRSNIVLEGLAPFEEDTLREIKIGNTVLEIMKPCDRCPIPTIDQRTGISTSKEPISTMVKTRFGKGGGLQGVYFGQNAVPRELGAIKVGDEVEILSRQDMHPVFENMKLKAKAPEPS